MRGWLVVAVLLVWSTVAQADDLAVRSLRVHTSHARVGSALEVSSLYIDATYPAGTTSVAIVVRDRAGHTVTTTLTPDQNDVRLQGALEPGPATATLTLTGAQGATSTVTIPAEVRRPYTCGLGAIVLIPFLLLPAGLILLGVALGIRSAMRRRKLAKEGTEVAPLVAEAMVQAVIRRILIVIAVGSVLCLTLWFSGEEIYAFLVAYVPFTRLFHLAGARSFLASLESGLPTKLHDNLLVTLTGNDLRIPRGVIRSVQSRAVPTTTLTIAR